MLKRQTTGSIVCPSCGKLVGVNDDKCFHCGRRNPGMWGFAGALRNLGRDLGFVPFLMVTCGLIYLAMLAMDPNGVGKTFGFGFLSPGGCATFRFGASGQIPLLELNRWWTPLTANWLHGGLLHIAFNLYWIRYLGPSVANTYGPARSAILYILSGVGGFLITSGVAVLGLPGPLRGAGFTVGASAAIFGWIGALVYYGRRSGQTSLSRQLIMGVVLPLIVLGLVLSMMDNWAHIGGFAAGYFLGRVLDPLKPERTDHAIVAFALIGISLLAVVYSVFFAWSPELAVAVGCTP